MLPKTREKERKRIMTTEKKTAGETVEVKNVGNVEFINATNFATGETMQYESRGYKLNWSFLKNQRPNQADSFVTMSLAISTIADGERKAKSLTIKLSLSQDEMDYLNYVNDGVIDSLRKGQATKLGVMTRFIYGKNEETGNYWCLVRASMAGGKVTKSEFLSGLHALMFNDSIVNKNGFNIFADYSEKKQEEISDENAI